MDTPFLSSSSSSSSTPLPLYISLSAFLSSSWVLLSASALLLALGLSAPPLVLSAYDVHGVAHVDEAGRGHKHDLENLVVRDTLR